MHLYVVRHGETVKNIVGLVQGDTESLLTENGKEQARMIGRQLHDYPIDLVFSSPLSRAYQTACIITDFKKDIRVEERLIERDYGDFEGKTREEFDYVAYWNFILNLKDNHGECVQDLCMRVQEFLDELKQKYSHSNILVVTHSGVARALHYCVKGIPKDGDLSQIDIPNCSVMEYDL